VSESIEALKRIANRLLPERLRRRLRSYYLERKVLTSGVDVEPEMKALRKLILPGQVALDIGANVGFYTRLLSSLVGTSGQVFAFEPIGENFEILQRVVSRGGMCNTKVFRAAVAQQAGKQEMVIPRREDFTGFYQAKLASEGEAGERQTVQVVSLDQLANERVFSMADFIKCDAEGSELAILEGGIDLLRQTLPALLIEVQRKTGAEVFALLSGLGYKTYRLDGRLVEVKRFDPRFWNYIFLHPARMPHPESVL
jgi:FkbM family methyltransferase